MKKNAAVVRVTLIAVIGLCGSAALAAQTVFTDPAQSEADAYLSQARIALAAGSHSEASDLTVSAIQLAPDYSEALYARAQIELADRSSTLAAVNDLQKALSNASWTLTDPSVARQDLAEVLLRTGRLREADALLSRLAAHDPSDSRTALLLARLFEREGDTAALRRTLSDAATKFPLNDDFAILSSRLLEREGSRSGARRVVAMQLKIHPQSLPLLLRAAELEPRAGARVDAVDRYAAQGGRDPLAAVIALESSPRNAQKYLTQFTDDGGLSREDLVERVARATSGSRSLVSAFQSDLSQYSGSRDLDPQGDGQYQERWTFQDGAVVSWVRDTHRDGRPELAARFARGLPVSLTIRTAEDTLLTLSYSTYPDVDSAEAPAGAANASLTYRLVPYSLKIPFLAADRVRAERVLAYALPIKAGLAPRAARNPERLSVDQVQRSSYLIEETAADGAVIRRIELLRGRRVFMEENTLGKGAFDHRVWYENGQPVRGARDLDGSGRFAVAETWRDGKLAGIAVDTNGDGKVDYRERYIPSLMKSWDYDEDGVDDSREFSVGSGSVVREFSTRMNGVFDVCFVWKSGELVRVTRGGMAVAVTRDPARGVVWIGPAVAAGVPLDASAPEGYRSVEGKHYFVFRREGVTYVEEMP